jgi:acyl phosphate:glycerol-3-phosphate acyltransferase
VLGWILFGYALGSVPFAFLVARRAGIDVCVSGSGNVGAANVLRTTGAAAIVGHIYPVWRRFHGGKGVAVATGVFGVLAPIAAAAAAAVFLAIVWLTRLVSMGSIAATVTLPSIAMVSGAPPQVLGAAMGTGTLILFRHRANLRRLIHGTERRMGERAR